MNHFYKSLITSVLFLWIISSDVLGQVNPYFSWQGDCSGSPTYFIDNSTGPIAAWNWDFGNGNYSASQNASFTYVNPGTYTVILTVYDSASIPFNYSKVIVITNCNQQLVANFGWDYTCKGDSTRFFDNSAGPAPIVSWLWNFGDNSTSTLKDPLHQYADTGAYQVILSVTDTANVTKTHTNMVFINACPPMVDFSWYNNCLGDTTSFNAYFDNTDIIDWAWNFGDNTSGNGQFVNHFYTNAGTYNVSLIYTNSNNIIDTIVKTMLIDSCQQYNAIDFSWSGNCKNSQIVLNSYSIGTFNPVSWYWDLGNGNYDSLASITHVFADTGLYAITLTATDAGGKIKTQMHQLFINDCTPQLNAYFGWDFTCKGDSTKFSDYSYGPAPIVSWLWNFGDSSTSILQKPVHQYADTGMYIVTLTVTDTANVSKSVSNQIFINECPPMVDFNWYNTCLGDTVQFNGVSNNTTITNWVWEFGDSTVGTGQNISHHYPTAGFYDVALIFTNATGIIDTLMRQIRIDSCQNPPNISINWSNNCKGDSIFFNVQNAINITDYNWSFGDGNFSTSLNPVHLYQNDGNYNLYFSFKDSKGKADTIYRNIQIINCGAAGNSIDFGWNGNCKGDTTFFMSYSSSNYIPVAWNWNFGDGNYSTLQNPQHNYADTGVYFVSLNTLNTAGIADSASRTVFINDCGQTPLNVAITWSYTCLGESTQFSALANGPAPVFSYLWNFGDGSTSTLKDPLHVYVDTGLYTITVIVTDTAGQTATATNQVYINSCGPNGFMDFVWANECAGSPTSFTDLTTYQGVGHWLWNFGDGVTDSTQNTSHTYAQAGSYTVTLVVYDSTKTNSDSLSKTITIRSVNVNAGPDVSICQGSSAVLTASGSVSSYLWNTGATTKSISVSPTVTTNYVVYGNDSLGCSASDSIKVTVSDKPVLTFTKTDATCGAANGTATVTVSGGIIPYTYQWTSGATNNVANNLSANTYSVSVADALGCTVSGSVNIGNSNGPSVNSVNSLPASCPSTCDGSATVSASGGTLPYSYSWNTSPIKTTASVSGMCPGTYVVIIKDANNCAVTASATIGFNGNNPSLSGTALTNNGQVVNKGKVQLFGVTANGAFGMIGSAPIDSGAYRFPSFPSGTYLIAAVADSLEFPYAIRTYYDLKSKWTESDTLSAYCNDNLNIDLRIINLAPMSGIATVSGTIVDVTGGKRASEPLPGVDVSLEEDPDGIIVANTVTDNNGYFQFNQVNTGIYKIYVDIPGLGMVQTHGVTITENDTVFDNKNFFVDSTGTINTIYVPASINTAGKPQFSNSIFPNPYKGATNIAFAVEEAGMVTLEVFNIQGKRIIALENSLKQAGEYKYRFSAMEIGETPGIYIVKLNINGAVSTQRIIEIE